MKISVSQLKQFKACRRAWYFKYKELLEPVRKSDALTIGTNYHAKLEELYRDGIVDVTESTKETAMALAYAKYIFPYVKIARVEQWVEKQITPIGDILIGRIDGVTEDGIVVEHKTTSRDIGGEYEYDLMWDEQVLAYMHLTGSRKIIYTVCRKPTIRQRKDETEDEFFQRMVEWYDEDTDSKIRWFEVERTDAEVEAWVQDLVSTVIHMQGNETCYRNTMHCHSFGSQCPYRGICLNYDKDQEYVDYVRRENTYGDDYDQQRRDG